MSFLVKECSHDAPEKVWKFRLAFLGEHFVWLLRFFSHTEFRFCVFSEGNRKVVFVLACVASENFEVNPINTIAYSSHECELRSPVSHFAFYIAWLLFGSLICVCSKTTLSPSPLIIILKR